MIHEYVPVKYYKNQGVLTGDPVLGVPMIKDVYSVSTPEEIAAMPECCARFRKSEKLQTDAVDLSGLVKLVEYRAKLISVKIRKQKSNTSYKRIDSPNL